jgi:squalene synthase HpnC/squalene synthase HpnD
MAYSFAAHLARFGPGDNQPPLDLAQAQSYCARLTRSHYENFSVASIFLPRRLRRHFYPVYAYCRWADDLGDETGGGERALGLLAWWRRQLLDLYDGATRHPVMTALKPTIERFQIPPEPFLDLLTAFEQDQRVDRYATFADLLDYCRCSANPVGRLVLYLCDSFDEARAVFSDRICTGLQLANFWQDVERDFKQLGRVYLPDEDRECFGFGDDDLRSFRCTPAFRALMKFQVDRARQFFDAGRPLTSMMPADVAPDIELFINGGLAILKKIEQVDFDVLSARPRLKKWEKGALVLQALRSKTWIGNGRAAPPVTTDARNGHCIQPAAAPALMSEVDSFAWCHDLTRRTAKNFYCAFLVLPRRQRRAMEALYAFMRVTDDLSDEVGETEQKRADLKQWRADLVDCLNGQYSHPLHAALHEIVSRYAIPPRYLHDVIDGVESDLEPGPFATFADLRAYCYRVASAVGLCCIHIWGFRGERAREFAEAAGVAFQLTNILRDLREDLDRGRVYLPVEDIERFQSPPDTWRHQDGSFRRLMQFQVERAQEYYRQAELLTPHLNAGGKAVFQVMLRIYGGLLEKIEARDYDVFRERARLSRGRKLRHLLLAFPIRWGWA